MKKTDIPHWPAMMKRSTAAAYLDISEPSLIKEIFAGRLPTGVMLGGREHWRKDAIDAALDYLGGPVKPPVPDHIREFEERIAQYRTQQADAEPIRKKGFGKRRPPSSEDNTVPDYRQELRNKRAKICDRET